MRTPTVILMTVCLPAALGLPVPVAQVSQVGGSDGGVTAPPASRGFQLDPASAGIGSVAGTGSGALGLHLLTNGDNVWNRQRVQQLEKERPTLMQENYDMGREHEAADRAAPGQKMKECFDYMLLFYTGSPMLKDPQSRLRWWDDCADRNRVSKDSDAYKAGKEDAVKVPEDAPGAAADATTDPDSESESRPATDSSSFSIQPVLDAAGNALTVGTALGLTAWGALSGSEPQRLEN